MFNPSWRSTTEDAFLWIGGWRPTMAFHLLYSKSGIQMEARLDEIIRGVTRGDLSELSGNQLGRVDKMQMETVKAEKEITEKFAQQQEKLADTCMVELSHNVSEMMRGRDGMVRILYMADDLRLKTLKKVIEVLSPIQGVHFLIAAAELHLRVHEWGKKMDAHSQVDEAHGHDGGGGHI